MPESANSTDLAADERALAEHAGRLVDGVEAALPGWVVRSVVVVAEAWRPGLGDELRPAAGAAGTAAVANVVPRLRALLATDVDEQRTGPLAVIRTAVQYPSEVLAAAGVGPVQRDEFAERSFPDDAYDLAPASFADLDPNLHEPGLMWGAAKAHVVLARRRAEGKR